MLSNGSPLFSAALETVAVITVGRQAPAFFVVTHRIALLPFDECSKTPLAPGTSRCRMKGSEVFAIDGEPAPCTYTSCTRLPDVPLPSQRVGTCQPSSCSMPCRRIRSLSLGPAASPVSALGWLPLRQ